MTIGPSLSVVTGLRSSLATNLRRVRTDRGLTLRELASRADVSKALLSKIERGDGNPSIETLYRIAAATGCTVSELIEVETLGLQVVRAGEGRVIPYDFAHIDLRLLFASSALRRFELYRCEMQPDSRSEFDGKPQFNVTEYALVHQGSVRIGPVGNETLLHPGDSIAFRHDTRNVYESLAEPVALSVILAYDAELNTSSQQPQPEESK